MELVNLPKERVMLNNISVYGYKSIKKLENFKLNNINILIGINGAGKSNIISIFKLLNNIYNRQLQSYSLKTNIDSMFYMGTKNTKNITLEFEFNQNKNKYKVELKATDDNRIVVAQDVFDYHKSTHLYKITENKLESDMADATTSAQNLIANEMYSTIMNSGSVNDMINNASNLANNHVNTNLSGIDNAKQAIGDMAKEGANQVKGAVNDVKNAVKSVF